LKASNKIFHKSFVPKAVLQALDERYLDFPTISQLWSRGSDQMTKI